MSNQNEIFNKLVNKSLEEITDLDKKVNPNDLIYRYKGFTPDTKFNEFDNAFRLLDKIRDGKIILADAQNGQEKTKSIDYKSKKCIVLY